MKICQDYFSLVNIKIICILYQNLFKQLSFVFVFNILDSNDVIISNSMIGIIVHMFNNGIVVIPYIHISYMLLFSSFYIIRFPNIVRVACQTLNLVNATIYTEAVRFDSAKAFLGSSHLMMSLMWCQAFPQINCKMVFN